MTVTTPLRPLTPSELTIDGGFWGDFQQLNEQVLFNRVTVDQAVQQFRSQAESAIAG